VEQFMPRKRRPGKTRNQVTPAYAPSVAEATAVLEMLERSKDAPPFAKAKVEKEGERTVVSWRHPIQPAASALWARTLGTTDMTFAATILEQLAHMSRTGVDLKESELNASLSLVRSLAPNDPTEALLVVQMTAIHNAMMVAARRLNFVETIEQQDSASSMLNKLGRTFALQVETLKRYRQKGEQIIKVQHVTVNEGGQAIVGNVQPAPGVTLKSENQPHELTASDAPRASLVEQHRNAPSSPAEPRPCAAGRCVATMAREPVPRKDQRTAPIATAIRPVRRGNCAARSLACGGKLWRCCARSD
jgi:hypothetical protein